MSDEGRRFTHTGFRYVLGVTSDAYAIWDRTAPAEPAERFPRNDEGWVRAWRRFAQLEPHAEAVGGAPAPRATGIEPLDGPARTTRVLLLVSALLAVVSAAVAALELPVILRVYRGESVARSALSTLGRREALFSLLSTGAVLATGIAWLMWQYRGHANVRALGRRGLRITPAWAVAWWFIPIASLWMPLVTMRELWRASDPEADADRWPLGRVPALFGWWWALFLLSGGGGRIGLPPLRAGSELLLVVSWGRLATDLLTVPAAVVAATIVARVTARHRDLIANVEPPASPDAAAAPVEAPASAATITHAGPHHVLGYDASGYAIWPADPGPGRAGPSERFEPSGVGWGLAWRRFAELEPRWVAVGEQARADAAAPPSGVANAARISGIAAAALGIVGLAVLFGPLAIVLGAIARGELSGASGPFVERDRRRARTGIVTGAVGTAASVAVIIAASVID